MKASFVLFLYLEATLGEVKRVNKKILSLLAIIIISVAVAIPVYSTLAVKPKPKILVRMDLPLHNLGMGSSEIHGDKIIFSGAEWDENETVGGARLLVIQWLPNPDPGPTHVPAPSVSPLGPVTHMYTGGEIYATAHGIRDAYTMVGTWHMEFVVTFDIGGVDSGFQFKHTCKGVGMIHAATWSGSGFGALEGIKVSGVSIADISRAFMEQMPVTKILFGEVSSGYTKLPPRNVPVPS